MLCGMCRKFLSDDRGAGTIMGLLWFILLVGITGMAVDSTNGFRNRTMLQATADAAALGGAIDLMNGAAVAASAVAYSASNMQGALYGDVLQPGDVEIGSWDMATRSFTAGGLVVNVLDPEGPLVPDAVRVIQEEDPRPLSSIDRIWRGEVVDFLYVRLWTGYAWPDFNLADVCIILGVAALMTDLLSREAMSRAA